MKHADGSRDNRYSIQQEFCGYPQAMWVARFCGEWIGCDVERIGAEQKALNHALNR